MLSSHVVPDILSADSAAHFGPPQSDSARWLLESILPALERIDPKPHVRAARLGDLDALLALEQRCFPGDRLSRRSFRHLLSRGHATLLVAERRATGQLLGYVLITLRERSRQARLYSLAVDPDARKLGLARQLLATAERAAREAGCVAMRLEVRADNLPAIQLYRSIGYQQFASRAGYYQDGEAALCFVRSLVDVAPTDAPERTAGVLVLVDRLEDWRLEDPRIEVMTAQAYLDSDANVGGSALIINLCQSQHYQSRGYYCSLLAEARGQRVIPSPQTMVGERSDVASVPRPVQRAPRERYRLALLIDPGDPTPPSTAEALHKFIAAGHKLGVGCELLTPREADRLAEFDALFIRTTTAVDHFTYRLARRAELDGLIVIDDSRSILRCTNKIYQHELFRRHAIPTPASIAIARGQLERAEQLCGYPIVIKTPDGSCSLGVHKADDRAALERHTRAMFERSELLLAQEFTYTEFDWRIGVLDRQPIYASQYFMADGHWQVIDCNSKLEENYGPTRTVLVEQAPAEVIDVAVRAANLMGDGLYGVDLKQTRDGRVLVIEVNDNPNIDVGGEDQLLGDRLFERIIGDFRRRLEQR